MRDAEQGPTSDSPSELTDPELAAFIGRWTALGRNARLLVTSRYPIATRHEVIARLTLHHLGPLSRVETDKLMWRLTALDALEPDERDRAYADVGGHPRALEYVDSLLRGRGVRFADVAARMETALRTRGIEDPSGWLAPGPRDLGHALAETVTLIVDDVLVDRLMVRLQSFPLALRLFVAASVFRAPVDAMGLNWAVAESLAPGARRGPRGQDRSRLRATGSRAGGRLRLHPGATRAARRAARAVEAGLRRSRAPAGASRPRPRHRGTAGYEPAGPGTGLPGRMTRSTWCTGGPHAGCGRWSRRAWQSLVDPAELTQAHLRAAAYYEWRADIWPDAVADLLEARHHYQESGERAVGGRHEHARRQRSCSAGCVQPSPAVVRGDPSEIGRRPGCSPASCCTG